MKFIKVQSNDVYYNLALEEYLFNNYTDDSYLLLWKNDSSIVFGKYQNPFEEINIKKAEMSNIKMARRMSGGGTVFHDMGNLNYTFMSNYSKYGFSNYKEFVQPVVNALNNVGIPAQMNKKGDITINDCKVSGSAQTIKKGRILHHGTLLFDAELSTLNGLLKEEDGDIASKSVKSVRSKVTNIKEHTESVNITLEDLENEIINSMAGENDVQEFALSEEDLNKICDLYENKYSLWEWNFGNTPKFEIRKEKRIDGKLFKIELFIEKGIISKCNVEYGDSKEDDLLSMMISERLISKTFSYSEFCDSVKDILNEDELYQISDCLF